MQGMTESKMEVKTKISLTISPTVKEWVDSTRASWDPPISRSAFIEACVRSVIEIQDHTADLFPQVEVEE